MEKNLVLAEIDKIQKKHLEEYPLLGIKAKDIEKILVGELIGIGDDRLYLYFGDLRHDEVCVPFSKIENLRLISPKQVVQIVNLHNISEQPTTEKLQELSNEITKIECSLTN